MSDDFKHGLMVKIHVRSTILLSVPNLSQNCPEYQAKSSKSSKIIKIIDYLSIICDRFVYFFVKKFSIFSNSVKKLFLEIVYPMLWNTPQDIIPSQNSFTLWPLSDDLKSTVFDRGFCTGHAVAPNVKEFWDGTIPWGVFQSIWYTISRNNFLTKF